MGILLGGSLARTEILLGGSLALPGGAILPAAVSTCHTPQNAPSVAGTTKNLAELAKSPQL